MRRTFAPLRDTTGAVEAYFVFSRDLIDLRQTEHDLAEQSPARSASYAEEVEKPFVPTEMRELLAQILPGIDLATSP